VEDPLIVDRGFDDEPKSRHWAGASFYRALPVTAEGGVY